MNRETWAIVESHFLRWPDAMGSPVDPATYDREMAAFESIDPDYREFVLRYGGGMVGSAPIYGLRRARLMGNVGGKATVPEITRWFKEKRWPGVEDWLIFSIDLGGNPVGFARDCSVWLSDAMDFQAIVRLASGFEDYLLKWCLKIKSVE